MLRIKNTLIRSHYNRVKAIRAAVQNGHGAKVVEVFCAGDCGHSQHLRADKVKAGHVFICNAKKTRDLCKLRIPHVINGKVSALHYQAAGSLTGIEYRPATKSLLAVAAIAELVRVPLLKATVWLKKRQKAIEAAKRKGNE